MVKRILLLGSIMGVMQGAQQETKDPEVKKVADKALFLCVYEKELPPLAHIQNKEIYRVRCAVDFTFKDLAPRIQKKAEVIFDAKMLPTTLCSMVKQGDSKDFVLNDGGTLKIIRAQ